MAFSLASLILVLGVFVTPLSAQGQPVLGNGSASAEPSDASGLSLSEVRYLSGQGSPELALSLVDSLQAQTDGADWTTLEKERVHLLRVLGRWDQADARLIRLSEAQPLQRIWATEQRAGLALQADRPEVALKVLRDLIGSHDEQVSTGLQLAQWRRMLIEAYFKLHLDQDANQAMQRYLEDYAGQPEIGPGFTEISLLQARILLRRGQAEAVPGLLKTVEGREAQLLRLLSRLRLAPEEARWVMAQATALASRNDIDRNLKFEAWALVADAARISGHHPGYILALERLLGAERLPRNLTENFGIRVDSLWKAYRAYGRELVERQGLALGDTEQMLAWISPALQDDPVKARGGLALILEGGRDPDQWTRSATMMMDLLEQRYAADQAGARLVVRIMGRRDWRPAIGVLPDAVTEHLVQKAVGVGELMRAREWLQNLNDVDRHGDDLGWHRRLARMSLLVGDAQAAVRHIHRLMDPETGVLAQDNPQADELIQLILDIQAQGRHDMALELFGQLLRMPLSLSLSLALKKELSFWMGDSYRAQQHYGLAARAYLHSAELARRQGDAGHWADTARFEAAHALERAGFLSDARVQYLRLLQSTRDNRRAAMIRVRLERLSVMEAATLAPANSVKPRSKKPRSRTPMNPTPEP